MVLGIPGFGFHVVIWQEVAVINIFFNSTTFLPIKLKGTAQKSDRLKKLPTFVKVIIECLITKHISNHHSFGLASLRKSGEKG